MEGRREGYRGKERRKGRMVGEKRCKRERRRKIRGKKRVRADTVERVFLPRYSLVFPSYIEKKL